LLAVWAVGVVVAFWHYELRFMRAFAPEVADARGALFAGADLQARLDPQLLEALRLPPADAPSGVTVLHFWDPRCPCSRFNELHLNEIHARYGDKGIGWHVLTPPDAPPGAAAERRFRRHFGDYGAVVRFSSAPARLWQAVPAVPAALVLGPAGASYLGPYAVGGLCTSANGQFVETALDQLLAGTHEPVFNLLAFGCFCPTRPLAGP